MADSELVRRYVLCPRLDKTFHLVGKRWIGQIIDVLHYGPCRFTDLARLIDGLSDRILSERLKELEQAGVVQRHSECHSNRYTYALTEKGQALAGTLEHLKAWAEQWMT